SAGSAPYVPGYANAPQQYDDGGVDFEYDGDTAVDEYGNTVLYGEPRTPTPRDAVDLVKNWLQGGLGTPTPALTAAMTAGIETPGTLTPDAGGDDGEAGANEPTTPTAAAMPTTPAVATVAATTDTPAVTKTVATVVAASPTPSPPTPTPTAGRTGSPGPTQTARK
ncbi:MAG TPA: hypothetical protein VEB21_15945, partial [Terriglobales bacterium]|nr:hypothetical protein [Terriglobales bacterium]